MKMQQEATNREVTQQERNKLIFVSLREVINIVEDCPIFTKGKKNE